MTTHDYGSSALTGSDELDEQAAGTAKGEARHVAGVAKDEAQDVAAEARRKASDLMSEARSQLEEQSRTELDRLVGLLRDLGDDLERMVRGEGSGGGVAQGLVTEVSERARSLSSQIAGREPADLLDQMRGFARRRPGAFLLGAVAAGVVAGRLTRGAKEAADESDEVSMPRVSPDPVGAAPAADPLAGIDAPARTPVGGTS